MSFPQSYVNKIIMKNISYLFFWRLCTSPLASVYAGQIPDRGKSNYKSHTGAINRDTIFRVNEIDLEATGIENMAQLVNLRFERNRGIIRLDDTELIEDDAPATGIPEGYSSYGSGPVEWVEDLKKGIVIKKILDD